tara:strand:+ start:5256 stop:6011 length:756 start_codon:yes stop_codon:yes gene_type:complete
MYTIYILVAVLIIIAGYLWYRRVPHTKYVVSLTTIPSRLSKLQPVLDSYLSQSIKPEKIILNIPREYMRFPGKQIQVPDYGPHVLINRTPEDYGPATKLLGTLGLKLDPDTIIIVSDDDNVKKPYWARDLIRSIRANPGAASTVSTPWSKRPGGAPGKFIFGGGGFGFYRKLIDSNVLMNFFTKAKSKCMFVDDDMFTYFFDSQNIEIVGVDYGPGNKPYVAESNEFGDKLRSGGPGKRETLQKQCKAHIN